MGAQRRQYSGDSKSCLDVDNAASNRIGDRRLPFSDDFLTADDNFAGA
jgi:hypothetical protein